MTDEEKAGWRQAILETVNQCDGMEVPRELWAIAEELVAEGKIESLGPARGPDRGWRRAEPTGEDD